MGGFACSTDFLPNAGPTASTCGPIVLTLNHPLGVQIVNVVISELIEMLIRILFNLKKIKKMKA